MKSCKPFGLVTSRHRKQWIAQLNAETDCYGVLSKQIVNHGNGGFGAG